MQTIEELRQKIYPLPCRFAEKVTGNTNISDTLNFEAGFTSDYSKSYASEGKKLQRNDFNRLGEVASRESVYRESGGQHTFSSEVSSSFDGYPKGALLLGFDGIFAAKVESQEASNTKAFAEDGIVIPNVIDCPLKIDGEAADIPSRVLWKSVSWINGVEEGFFKIYLDYTRLQHLKPGEVITNDSLVIGTNVEFLIYEGQGDITVDYTHPLGHKTQISNTDGTYKFEIINKGKYGDAVGTIAILWPNPTELIKQLPMCTCTGGTGNYSLYFFAKAGTSFSGTVYTFYDRLYSEIRKEKNEKEILWTAIPIKPVVAKESTYD